MEKTTSSRKSAGTAAAPHVNGAGEAIGAATIPTPPAMRMKTSNLKSTYCNMCNANSTREEVVLNFGVNESWDRGAQDVEVSLEHRVILSPFAAKRLVEMLNRLMAEHEARYGALK